MYRGGGGGGGVTGGGGGRYSRYLDVSRLVYKQNGFAAGPKSSGAVRKSRWPPWAFHLNEPCGFWGRKATLNSASALVAICP